MEGVLASEPGDSARDDFSFRCSQVATDFHFMSFHVLSRILNSDFLSFYFYDMRSTFISLLGVDCSEMRGLIAKHVI